MSQPSITRKGFNMAPKHPLLAVLSDGTAAKEETNDRGGRLYASQAGFCARAATLSAIEVYSRPISVSSSYYTEIGNAIHNVVKRHLRDAGHLLAEEAHISVPLLNLSGRIDIVANYDGTPRIIEVKSCGKVPTSPHASHFAQAAIYGAFTGLPFDILYVSRSVLGFNGQFQMGVFSYPAPTTPSMALITAVHAAVCVKRRIVPDKPFSNDSECRFCDHYDICWAGKTPSTLPFATQAEQSETMLFAMKIASRFMRPENIAWRKACFLAQLSSTRKGE